MGERERAVAQHVDAARNAATQAMDQRQRLAVEGQRQQQARDMQAMRDVGRRFGLRQCFEVVAHDDALCQRFEFPLLEHAPHLGLADQHHLQLAPAPVEVGEQAQLLEHLGRERLRLVDHDEQPPAARVREQQVAVQRIDHVHRRAAGRQLDLQVLEDARQHGVDAQLRIDDIGDIDVGRQIVEEAPPHGRLAGADFARQQNEAAAARQAVGQQRQRLAVPLAQVQEARVRCDRERLLLQAEEGFVHRVARPAISAVRREEP